MLTQVIEVIQQADSFRIEVRLALGLGVVCTVVS